MGSFDEGSTNMDARIWGNLWNYIDLALIYVKLPIGDFFRLREVCKEWNRLASDREFLEDSFRGPIPKPYFVVDSGKMGHRLLARDASSGRWSWTRLPSANCAVAGLLCKYRETSNSNCVFNLHTRVFHALPPAPETPEEDAELGEPLVSITVDTAVRPYGFKVFLGVYEIGTRIYDSKSGAWTQKPSTHDFSYLALDSEHQQKPYSIFCNGAFCDFGVWQDRLWYLRHMFPEADAEIEVVEHSVGAGEGMEGDWMVSDRMPEDLKTWLMAGQEDKVADFGEEIEMQGVFCGEYVLVYNCAGVEDVTERAVLYNLEGKTWEKLQLPPSWPRMRPFQDKKMMMTMKEMKKKLLEK